MHAQDRVGSQQNALHPVLAGCLGGFFAMDLAVVLAIFAGLSLSGMVRLAGYDVNNPLFLRAAIAGAFVGWAGGMAWGAYLARYMAARAHRFAAGLSFIVGIALPLAIFGLIFFMRSL